MTLFDAHCHLQDKRLDGSLDAVLARAKAAGVGKMICCGVGVIDWPLVQSLANTHSSIVPCFGLHPWYVETAPMDWFDTMQEFLLSMPSGVGEVGLDFAIESVDREKQEKVFRLQIRMANMLRRPVSIHCRKAWPSLIKILSEETLRCGGMIHGFSGSPQLIPHLEKLGLFISFSASITRPNNKRGYQSVRAVSTDRLLAETDSPDMPPAELFSTINEPANLSAVVTAIAKTRGISADEVAVLTSTNSANLFSSLL